MKAKLFSILLLTSFFYLASYSQDKDKRQDPKFKKEKSYSKSYNVSSSDKISLENQFGEMKLNTWNKNEVKVDVSITGMSDDEARAQQILDKISIQDEKTGGGVSFKTKFANDPDQKNHDKNEHRNEGMKVNYTVYLPASNTLWLKNQFGATIVPDYNGEATIESQFGSLTAGKINNAKNITVGFGKADIGMINNGKIKISYSTGTIDKLKGSIDADFQFCNAVKVNVDNDVKDLEINNSYSTVYVDVNKSLSAAYDISTSFGSFSNKSNFTINESGGDKSKYGPHNSAKYSGTSGSGELKLKIHSSFGQVILGHDLKVDTKKKKTA